MSSISSTAPTSVGACFRRIFAMFTAFMWCGIICCMKVTISHQSEIVTFMQQMIPHHINAVNMAKILLKHAPTEVGAVEDMEDILWGIINTQNYEVHQFRNYLAGHHQYRTVTHDGIALNATSLGEHCDANLDIDVAVTITSNGMTPAATSSVSG